LLDELEIRRMARRQHRSIDEIREREAKRLEDARPDRYAEADAAAAAMVNAQWAALAAEYGTVDLIRLRDVHAKIEAAEKRGASTAELVPLWGRERACYSAPEKVEAYWGRSIGRGRAGRGR
jgi:hypothetical protein